MAATSFFELLDHDPPSVTLRATEHAVGPWDPGSLHGGPPAAAMAWALDRHHDRQGRQPTRLSYDILRPVPVGELVVTTRVLRPGRKVELLAAEMATADGTVVMTLAQWRIRAADVNLGVGAEGKALPPPDGLERDRGFFRTLDWQGYIQSMDVRFVTGSWEQPGAATAWMRMCHPLLPDEEPSPLERVLVAADSGNGISARAGKGAPLGLGGLFINVDLTVHLARLPVDEWVGMEAATTLTDHGIGLATSTLHDRRGPLGRGAQSLLVDGPG